ncbi:MAG: hypothetical protein HYU60_05605 [Magnetospirillum sp.]|nr:hypothetical protein [Magnetospirillum sp.]
MADESGKNDGEEAEKKVYTKEECQALGRAAFDLVQRVRMLGSVRARGDIAKFFGTDPSRMSFERLSNFEQKCKRADISRGALFVDRGLVYICTIRETELGFAIGYNFICSTADWKTGNELVR